MSEAKPKRERTPPKIECKKTQCNENLHSFLDAPKRKKDREQLASPVPEVESKPHGVSNPQDEQSASPERRCWNCGASLVDWSRVHERRLEDVDYLFNCLKYE